MQINGKRVLVFGAGKSGISATKLLQKQGAYVILFDGNNNLKKSDLADIDTENNFDLVTGDFPEELAGAIDLLVLSPGVPTDLEEIDKMRQKNIPVWGEIELAYQFSKGKIIGITGTNGKTTTTTLVGEIMKAFYEEVFVVGNIGNPFTDIADQTTDNSIIVAELSSFQLETIVDFRPVVSAILNITPDHLNRHHTMQGYIKAKENITKNQTMENLCVLNYEDEELRKMADHLRTKVIFFSSARELSDGLYLCCDEIIYSDHGKEQIICDVNELNIFGKHNYENVMAGVAMAISMGVPVNIIRKALIAFKAVEHRIEYVATIDGVTYYNDSKGTNPDASIKAIEAMKTPTILIGGGYDKNSEFDDWIEAFHGKIRYLVLLGQTKEKIAETARSHGYNNIIMTDDLKEAVRICADKAENGDSVLLSPACASWGMFKNYEERGRLFKEYVREMLQ